MSPEDPTVGMELIDHYKFQILKEVHPLGVMRKDARVKHVGVCDDHISPGPNGLPGVLGRVSVVGECGDRFSDPLDEILEFKHLILGEGFSREEIKGL